MHLLLKDTGNVYAQVLDIFEYMHHTFHMKMKSTTGKLCSYAQMHCIVSSLMSNYVCTCRIPSPWCTGIWSPKWRETRHPFRSVLFIVFVRVPVTVFQYGTRAVLCCVVLCCLASSCLATCCLLVLLFRRPFCACRWELGWRLGLGLRVRVKVKG
jgi:hypothetical protein